MKLFTYALKLRIRKFHALSNILYHLIRTWKAISLFSVLIFGCTIPKYQSVGSYFLMFAGFTVLHTFRGKMITLLGRDMLASRGPLCNFETILKV